MNFSVFGFHPWKVKERDGSSHQGSHFVRGDTLQVGLEFLASELIAALMLPPIKLQSGSPRGSVSIAGPRALSPCGLWQAACWVLGTSVSYQFLGPSLDIGSNGGPHRLLFYVPLVQKLQSGSKPLREVRLYHGLRLWLWEPAGQTTG